MKNNRSQTPAPQPEADLLEPDAIAALKGAVTRIKDGAAAGVLAKCSPNLATTPQDVAAHVLFRHKIIELAGDPTDPLEVMLIEQFLMANQTIGALYVRAANATDATAINLYLSTAARLMGECRKTLPTLKEYRSPPPPPPVTIVRQQNVAGGDQQIGYLDKSGDRLAVEEKNPSTKLGYEPARMLTHEDEPVLEPIPESVYRRQPEAAQTLPTIRRRPRSAPVDGFEEPALAIFNGSTVSRRES